MRSIDAMPIVSSESTPTVSLGQISNSLGMLHGSELDILRDGSVIIAAV